jgi:DNA-binding LacI/PurR family transcriptional regulator
VAGVVISPTCETDLGCIRLVDSHIPLVTVDRRLLHVPSHRVLADNAGAAFELTAHLIKDGHTRIAGLFGLMSMTTGRERYEGYARALEAHGLPVDPALVRTGRPNEATGHAFTRELLALAVRPTAVLGGNNLLTMGALRAIRDTGLRIPADIGIASFDVVPWMPLVEPALTVVAMPTYEMGRVAAELLLQCIEGNPAPVREITLKARLQVGGSCYHHPALPGKAGREKEAVEPREGE